jgi:hypothetical protein
MNITFPDGTNYTMRALMEAIPEIVGEMLPQEASEEDKVLRKAIDNVELEVNGARHFVLHASRGCRVVVSNRGARIPLAVHKCHHQNLHEAFCWRNKTSGNGQLGGRRGDEIAAGNVVLDAMRVLMTLQQIWLKRRPTASLEPV